MDAALKYKIVERIIQSDDDMVLNQIKSLLGVDNKDFWHELPDELKRQVNTAKSELDDGLGIPHAEVMAETDKLLK